MTTSEVAETPVAPSNSQRHCVACALLIPTEASVCTHCNHFQKGWRRYVGVSQTVLALLIALISVMGVVIPRIVALFDRPKTDIKAVLLDTRSVSGNYDYHVWLTNAGSRSGIVKQIATLTSSSQGRLDAKMNDDYLIVEPGAWEVARFSVHKKSVPSLEGLVLTLDVVSFDSTPVELPVPVKVPDVNP